jgi:nucleoside-diphosphate-sugar epimerase
LITGASGYIGSRLTEHLIHADKENRVIALVRNAEKARALLPELAEIWQADLTDRRDMAALKADCDYIIHCASVTRSTEMIVHPVEVIESIVNTTQNVLDLARRCGVSSMVNLSSMEVYGNIDCSDGHRVLEEELGDMDILHVRSCYPMGKRMAETICRSYWDEYKVPVKTARLAQTFGRGILPTDNRVFAQFVRAAKEGKDIVLHTKGDSMGNYCGIDDAVRGIMTILHHGTDGESYNVVNEKNTMTIREMAELVAKKLAKGRIKIVYQIPDRNIYGYGVYTGLRLSGEKLARLGWIPEESLEDMYWDLWESYKKIHRKN